MPNSTVSLLLEADWVVPVVPRGAVHERFSLAISDGRIEDLGHRHLLPPNQLGQSEPVIIRVFAEGGHAVLPMSAAPQRSRPGMAANSARV